MPAGTLARPLDYLFNPKQEKNMPTKQFGNPNTFTAAANQQAKDYDKIMGKYGDVYDFASRSPITPSSVNYSNISPQTTNYQQSADVTKSLSDLSGLSSTGGYDEKGIADLRARGLSPIRSMYANAQRNIDRSKALSGGYSPNYGALTAKMAREQSDKLGGAITDINAGIAQNVASNKLSAAPNYASAAGSANAMKYGADKANVDVVNEFNRLNTQNLLDTNRFNSTQKMNAQESNVRNRLGAVQGMTSLYGTTPALTNTFGNQVMQAGQLRQNQQQMNNLERNNMNNLIMRRNG